MCKRLLVSVLTMYIRSQMTQNINTSDNVELRVVGDNQGRYWNQSTVILEDPCTFCYQSIASAATHCDITHYISSNLCDINGKAGNLASYNQSGQSGSQHQGQQETGAFLC